MKKKKVDEKSSDKQNGEKEEGTFLRASKCLITGTHS